MNTITTLMAALREAVTALNSVPVYTVNQTDSRTIAQNGDAALAMGASMLQASICIIWTIGDVQEVRPDLDDDQAEAVLRYVEDKHDANFGISWETLEVAADQLFSAVDDTS